MAENERYDSSGARLSYTGEDRSGSQVRSRLAAAAAGTTAGKGLGSLGRSDADMPRQEPGEDAAAYSEKLRAYRERKRAKADEGAQKSALRAMR